MATSKQPPARKPKAPGRNVEEWERSTVRVPLRVPETVARVIRERASSLDLDRSKYVAWLAMADVARQAGVELPPPVRGNGDKEQGR